jgi:phage/plasmid-like protein (TIGR03299 family)
MAHEVESMMYVGDTPWHGLGVAIPEGRKLSIEKAIVAAGLDWKVELSHIFTKNGRGIPLMIHNHYATYRKSDNTILGIVGKDYQALQNRDAFKWFQPFLESGEATIETAGSLKGGSKVWVLARIRRDPLSVGKEDIVEHYVLLSNSHDGSLAVRVGFTPIRVVCNNTLCLAQESKASQLLRVKHTSRVLENLEDIRETIDLAQREFAATVAKYKRLASKGINSTDLVKYVRLAFHLEDRERTPAQEKQEKIVPGVVRLFEAGRGSRIAGRNYWGAYNAVNEYLNYFRGKTQDNTLNSLWFGDSGRINKKALNIAIKMAA